MPSMSSPPVIDRDGSRPIKRKKTTRACDHCRAHRIRCEYVTSQGDCRHCIEYGFDCIKVAPAPPDKRRLLSLSTKSDDTLDTSQGLEPGYLGGTSLTQLVYTTCSTSSPRKPNIKRKLDQLDIQYDHYWESLDRTDGLGLLVGRDETSAPSASVSSSRSSGTGGSRVAKFSSLQARLAAELGSETLMDSPCHTVVSSDICYGSRMWYRQTPEMWWHRFSVWHTNSGPPTPLPPVVRLIHCTISSLSRDVPPSIRRSLLSALHEHLDNGEIAALSKTSSLANAQVLLLLSMNLELHAHEGSSAVSLLWQRAGVGLRMATELATHRNVSSSVVPIAQLHRRWRVWGACIITDRWLGLSQGQIMSINLEDCDAPLPFVYPDHFPDEAHSEGPACFSFFHELTKLSILLGRILRLTSTPSGLDRADDLGFYRLQRDLDSWEKGLPTTWAYSSKLDMPQGDPVFALLSVATEFTFLRSFMWPTRPIPTHISFRPDTSRWTNLILKAQQVIDWLATPLGAFHLDIWSITIYPLVCCAMIQLRSYRDTNDCVALQYLEKANTITQAWATEEGTVRPSRKKVADMVLVLFDMADGDGGGSSVLPVEEVLVSAFMS